MATVRKKAKKKEKDPFKLIDEELEKKPDNPRPPLFELEGWIPFIASYAFFDAQRKLQGKYPDNKTIIALLDEYDSAVTTYFDNPNLAKEENSDRTVLSQNFPITRIAEIGILRLIRKAIQLGPEKGRKVLIGDKAEKAFGIHLHHERQRNVGQRDKPDALQKIILKILSNNPHANAREVWDELKQTMYQYEAIDSVTDDTIEWTDENRKDHYLSLSSLRTRVSRARKKIKKK